MLAPWLSRSFDVDLAERLQENTMHPTLITMYANAQSEALREAASKRRRLGRTRSGRTFALRLPRRVARVAHV
jgi:hypothetical protein